MRPHATKAASAAMARLIGNAFASPRERSTPGDTGKGGPAGSSANHRAASYACYTPTPWTAADITPLGR